MEQRTTQWLGLGIGIALIVIYSIVMIATDGSAPLAWVLLIVGIGTIIAVGVAGRRHDDG